MTLGTVAIVVVAFAFTGLLIWVLLPANKARLEGYGRIPLADGAPLAPTDRRERGEPLT